MRRWFGILVGALALSACASSNAVEPAPVDDQFAQFLDWFPGRYDSAEQIVAYERDETPVAERNYRRHSIFRQVDLPAVGDTVFLAHQYRDGDPAKVYRQRLYTFTVNNADNLFRLRVHVPKDSDALKGAYLDPSRLSGLTLDDFTVWEGCDLFWQLEDDRFVGRLKPGACRFNSEAFGQEIVLDETLTLFEDQIWFADRGLSLSGDYLFGMRGTTPNISMKARPFICETKTQRVWVHDQGGVADVLGHSLSLHRSDRELQITIARTGLASLTTSADRDAKVISLDVGGETLICRYAPNTVYSEHRDPLD